MSVGFAIILAIVTAPPEAKATYYLAESKVFAPDGRPVGNLVSLVKRESYPDKSRIVETVLTLSSNPREMNREHVAIWTVDGQAFTLAEQGGAFTGRGELVGRPWEWTEWTTTTKTPGGTIQARTRLTSRGLSASKEFLGPDGVPRLRYVEDLASIDGGTYELFREKLFPKNAK